MLLPVASAKKDRVTVSQLAIRTVKPEKDPIELISIASQEGPDFVQQRGTFIVRDRKELCADDILSLIHI